jgi:adenylate cyclase
VTANTEQRKLAAIMFTDMVGYSALSQRNDKLALELLEEHRRLLREIFPRFNGTEIKTIGDAFLIEFHSALEAAQCAIEIQRTLAKRNHDVTAERRIELKIGLHIGDVVHRGGDVYGDGVNIASRIEALAGAGGICVSMDVERQIRNALEARFEKLAPTELKNISVAMDLFRIVLPWEKATVVETGESRKVPEQRQRILSWVAAALLLIVIAGGWIWWSHFQTASRSSAASSDIPAKSIAVLPFVDLSQAKDQEYFCDGISEEILDALAKIEGLRVVARTSSFSFKGKNADVAEIAQKLNVQNVLEGSLRREGNRIRVTAQLINARDGFHIWSDTFERELQGVFAVQDEITRAIVDALKVKLAVAPAAHPEGNTAAYDLYLQGLYLSNKTDEESLRKSLGLFQSALDADPNFARAWTGIAKAWLWLADAYVRPLDAWPKVENAASKALSLNEKDAEAHCYLGEWKRIMGRDPRAEQAELNRALELSPNLVTAHMFMSAVHSAECELDEATKEIQIAEKLDPISPTVIWFAVPIYAATGRVDAAVAAGKRLQVNPSDIYFDPPLAEAYRAKGEWRAAAAIYEEAEEQTHSPSSGLAVTYAKMGRTGDARRILNELIEKSRRQYVSGETIALIYLALGDREETFRWLKLACDEHAAGFYTFACFPDYRALHSDPRFADLVRRIGVEPAAVAGQKNP